MSEKKELVSLVPLSNFNSDVKVIQFKECLCIRQAEEGELDRLLEIAKDYRSMLEQELIDVKYFIEERFLPQPDGNRPSFWGWGEISPNVEDIVLALRLLKEGEIETLTAFLLDPNQESKTITTIAPISHLPSEPYFLKKEEVEDLIGLWRRLQDVESKKAQLSFPLKQFARAFEEAYAEDVIVDLMVAYESLVFRRGTESPRPYGRMIGIAIGMLIGRSEGERAEIEKDLKQAYEYRDKIVHGHLRKKLHDYTIEVEKRIYTKPENYLRRSLRKLIEE